MTYLKYLKLVDRLWRRYGVLPTLPYDKATQHPIRLKHLGMTIWINVENDNRFVKRVTITAKRDLSTYALNGFRTSNLGQAMLQGS